MIFLIIEPKQRAVWIAGVGRGEGDESSLKTNLWHSQLALPDSKAWSIENRVLQKLRGRASQLTLTVFQAQAKCRSRKSSAVVFALLSSLRGENPLDCGWYLRKESRLTKSWKTKVLIRFEALKGTNSVNLLMQVASKLILIAAFMLYGRVSRASTALKYAVKHLVWRFGGRGLRSTGNSFNRGARY
jgi:hypothetical protein